MNAVARRRAARRAGFALAELLVALAVGSLAAVAALSVYARSATDARTNLAVQQLHETARHAADLLERELRAAGHAGLAPDAGAVAGATPAAAPPPPGLAAAGCAPSLALDLARPVTAANGRYAVDAATPLACAPGPSGRAVAGADTLTIRRARAEPGPPEAGRLQLATTRTRGVLFADGAVPVPLAGGAVHDLEAATYYVAADSTAAPGVPSLRRKRLVGGPAGPRFEDEELAVAVEDLQVEFGLDGPDADEVPERYAAPDELAADETPRLVRFWLRVRSERPDATVRDTAQWRYADRTAGPIGDAHRRIVVSRTVYLRNLRRR